MNIKELTEQIYYSDEELKVLNIISIEIVQEATWQPWLIVKYQEQENPNVNNTVYLKSDKEIKKFILDNKNTLRKEKLIKLNEIV